MEIMGEQIKMFDLVFQTSQNVSRKPTAGGLAASLIRGTHICPREQDSVTPQCVTDSQQPSLSGTHCLPVTSYTEEILWPNCCCFLRTSDLDPVSASVLHNPAVFQPHTYSTPLMPRCVGSSPKRSWSSHCRLSGKSCSNLFFTSTYF